MMDKQNTIDSSDLRKFRTELPNMADDDLDPFQYRLYAHYKRVCGANTGECYEAVRTTAEKTRMSNEKVISTRQWLADNGWIAIEPRAKGTFLITIIDRWEENFVRYSEQSKAKTVRNSEQSTRRPLEISNSTVRNSEQSPLEISNQRKNLIKKEPNKNNDHAVGAFLRSIIEGAGFVYLDRNFNEIACKLESDYSTEQLIRAAESTKDAHRKKVEKGERGITAPLAYMATLLADSTPKVAAPPKATFVNGKEQPPAGFVIKRVYGVEE